MSTSTDFSDRLCKELTASTGQDPDRVRGAVERAVASFNGSRVQAYLPVLVMREAARALGDPAQDGEPSGDGPPETP